MMVANVYRPLPWLVISPDVRSKSPMVVNQFAKLAVEQMCATCSSCTIAESIMIIWGPATLTSPLHDAPNVKTCITRRRNKVTCANCVLGEEYLKW